MKFSTIFSALVAAIAVTTFANPVPIIAEQRSSVELNTRALPPVYKDSKEYAAVDHAFHAAGITPVDEQSYWFTLRWDLRDDADKDTSKVGILRQEIGAFHLAILVGKFTGKETFKGTAKSPPKISRDFHGTWYHTAMIDEAEHTKFLEQPFRVGQSSPDMRGKSILGGKLTTKYNIKKLKEVGEQWDEAEDHKIWNDKTNSCKSFTDYFEKHL